MELTTNPLPKQDVLSLFDILVVLLGQLSLGQVPDHLTERVILRLSRDGLLPREASVGQLRLIVADLVERLRFAMGDYASYPAPVPRLTRHDMSVPTHDAAQACRSELMQWGALAVEISKAADGTVWQVQASFPELVPDPSYARRVAQLQDLAAEQGGEYHGSGH
jgi:hypothetical protein